MSEHEHCQHHDHDHSCGCGHDHHHHHEHSCGCGHDHHHDHTHAHDHAGCGCGCGHDHGHEENQGVSVQFSGVFNLPKEQVWSLLTENDKLQSWYPELEFQGLETGASLKFNYKTGGHEDMMVLDVEPNAYLSFTWDLNIITFELHVLEPGKTTLIFTEWLAELNDHSPKDLTSWMIALQNMAEVAEGKPVSDREAQFHEYYPKIKEVLTQQTDVVFED